jgi:hypothetical protein
VTARPEVEESAMQPTPSLFEQEMRDQVAAAEAAVIEAFGSGDPILIEAARGHLDGLVNLAHRNGLDLKPLIKDDTVITLDPVQPGDVIDQETAAS